MYIVFELKIGSCCGLAACSFAVSPGTWPGVPGFLAGPALVGLFLLLLLVYDPNLFCHNT